MTRDAAPALASLRPTDGGARRASLIAATAALYLLLGAPGLAFVSVNGQAEVLAQLLQHRFIAHQEALSALSINPCVRLAERPAFARRMAAQTAGGFEIRERHAQRQLVRAAERPDDVPVGFIAPLAANLRAVGFDINSAPARADAIGRASRTGRVAIAEPIQLVRLVQDSLPHPGVLLLHPALARAPTPVDAGDERGLMGFAVGVIQVDEMVEIATRAAAVAGLVSASPVSCTCATSPARRRWTASSAGSWPMQRTSCVRR